MIHPVTHLEFSPVSPYDLAASVSANVNLYGGSPDLSPKSFSPLQHFEDVAYSPSFRCDGALLAAGGQSGLVQIFDPNRARLPLRRLRGHSRAVRVVRYPRIADKVHLFSGGDDAVLNYWDAATETRLLSFPAAHKDYIRAGSASPVSADLIATGSYDHMVRLWDVRSSENSRPLPPSGGLMATAGGNVVKLWDVISGGRMIHRLDCHNKTVTSVCLGAVGKGDEGEPRLLTASLDGYVKVFDYAAFRITHSTRFPRCSSQRGRLRRRRKPRFPAGSSMAREGAPLLPGQEEPQSRDGVMQELVARRKLLACVRAMDPQGLELLLSFLHKNATMPRYARFLMGLTTRVLQMRAEDIHSSPALRTHARNIKRMVAEEIKVQHALQEIQGIVSPLLRIAGR
ncbi:unnamed protein product [Spirodela intermedia]|uniref:U3 small nucleolar RNA-associated protein 15 C-terminal domain-containing protein n=1 Tax=Spirodela intermedia TaxID=51605 RepID=A0A7I8JNH5_SPIIN|nr:unnamed protein product [Spirodela intermedia]CAA6671335.1 unnamed protein product [Spirodela intermedia]